MGMESELKFLDADLDALRARLEELGAEREGCRFESNAVFDDGERSLKQGGMLLRVRSWTGRDQGLLTFKQPAAVPSRLKVYEEHETAVADPDQASLVLKGLGFDEVLVYQKVRESWRLPGVEVCLDRLPFGDFAELEGPEDAVLAAAEALGLNLARSSKETYHALHADWRESVGLAPAESFVFDEDARAAILRDIADRNLGYAPARKAP